ncbi:MAG: hypothetical protein HZB10_02405 [Candidatus Yonathbacteria bacterium]|nr:hypothetical protein [Candidatus Yonathbacteria bacterium]
MSREIMANQHLPFSVLFPGAHRAIKCSLVRHFHVLQLRCVKPLLNVCAEKLTRYAIALPEHPKARFSPFIDLEDLDGFAEERVDTLVVHWRDKISMYDDPDIAHIVLPKVFDFVRDQILLKEPDVYPFYLSENDIAALAMLIVKNTTVFYKGRNWWSNDRQIANTLEHWFVAS